MRHLTLLTRLGILTCLLLATVSCSSIFASSNQEKVTATKDPSVSADAKMPFSLEVVDEVNDGERLHVLGTVSAATNWNLKDVIVRLTGVDKGQTIGVAYLPLAKINTTSGGMIKAGEKQKFSLSVPSHSLTDYQVELLWGDEAKQYLATISSNITPAALELRKIEIETLRNSCEHSECATTYRLRAKLFNSGGRKIEKAVLGVGFVRLQEGQALDLSREIPQNEERVEIESVNLEPNASRPVVLNFDEPIFEKEMQADEGELRPVVRIISFE